MGTFLHLDMGVMSQIPLDTPDNLFLGNIHNALALRERRAKGFWAILNCTDDPELDPLKTDAEFDVMRLNQWDGEPYPSQSIKAGIEFIHTNLRAGSNVLVCCHAGMSRSPGMIVAYLMYRFLDKIPRVKQTLEDLRNAYDFATVTVHKARRITHIHPEIDKSIRQYFRLAPRTAKDLVG